MRGELAPVGHIRIAPNGYHYVKMEDGKWKLKHHLVAEQKLGRPINTEVERVSFLDKDRTNFDPDNIIVTPKRVGTKDAKKARLEAKIEELKGQLEDLDEEEEAS